MLVPFFSHSHLQHYMWKASTDVEVSSYFNWRPSVDSHPCPNPPTNFSYIIVHCFHCYEANSGLIYRTMINFLFLFNTFSLTLICLNFAWSEPQLQHQPPNRSCTAFLSKFIQVGFASSSWFLSACRDFWSGVFAPRLVHHCGQAPLHLHPGDPFGALLLRVCFLYPTPPSSLGSLLYFGGMHPRGGR